MSFFFEHKNKCNGTCTPPEKGMRSAWNLHLYKTRVSSFLTKFAYPNFANNRNVRGYTVFTSF